MKRERPTRRALAALLPAAAALLVSLVPVVLAGCGYALVGRGSTLPPEVKRVYLKPLENQTSRALVDQILTRALNSELVTRKTFEVVADQSTADAVLSGSVTSFALTPVSYDTEGRATQYEISIVVKVELKQLVPEKILYANDGYLFRASYEVQASELGFQDRETPAIESTADDFAETLVTDLLEGF
jgi:outer membrane lipopolysaccharide assembly protein LptE/RlpB